MARPGPTSDPDPGLADPAARALREAVTEAVLSAVPGPRDDVARDPEAALVLVRASRTAAETTGGLLRDAISGARAAGHSWDAIGRVLGVSRQAAQQRFGPAGPPPDAGPSRRVLTPLTAFDEMAVLELEGRRGWHVVDFGPLYHVVEASEQAWEHRRVVWAPGAARRAAADGWTQVGSLAFPWGYWKRPTGRPALPADA